ncbi:MAG: WD40 repeat domain-containing protein [Ktedonobacteraceae bacterium]
MKCIGHKAPASSSPHPPVPTTYPQYQLWNGLTGKYIYTYTKHSTSITHEVQAVAWTPNGRYIASGGMEGTVQVWNAV